MTATVTAVGRVVKDAEVRDTAKGKVLKFRMAVDGYNGGKVTDFYNVSVWRNIDFVAPQLVKGAFVVAIGALTVREYEYNGEKRKDLEINSDRVEASPRAATGSDDRRDAGAGPTPNTSRQAGGAAVTSDLDDEIPF